MRSKTARLLVILSSYFLIACEPADKIEQQKYGQDDSLCQFQIKPCEQVVNGNLVSMQFDKKHAPSEKPIEISLAFSETVSDVNVVVEGRDMYMGVIPVILTPIANMDYKVYNGNLIYGSCASGYMVWRANISFAQEGKTYRVWFDFLADAPSNS